MRVQCNACGATYDTVLADGTTYFHACAPMSVAQLTAAVAAGKVVLPNGETPDVAVTRRAYERATARDENLPSTKPADANTMKAPGAGVTAIGPTPPPKVVVP